MAGKKLLQVLMGLFLIAGSMEAYQRMRLFPYRI